MRLSHRGGPRPAGRSTSSGPSSIRWAAQSRSSPSAPPPCESRAHEPPSPTGRRHRRRSPDGALHRHRRFALGAGTGGIGGGSGARLEGGPDLAARDKRNLELRQFFKLPRTVGGEHGYETRLWLYFPRGFGITPSTLGPRRLLPRRQRIHAHPRAAPASSRSSPTSSTPPTPPASCGARCPASSRRRRRARSRSTCSPRRSAPSSPTPPPPRARSLGAPHQSRRARRRGRARARAARAVRRHVARARRRAPPARQGARVPHGGALDAHPRPRLRRGVRQRRRRRAPRRAGRTRRRRAAGCATAQGSAVRLRLVVARTADEVVQDGASSRASRSRRATRPSTSRTASAS